MSNRCYAHAHELSNEELLLLTDWCSVLLDEQ